MAFDYRPDNREAKTHAVDFSGEKRFEELRSNCFRDAVTAIGNGQLDAVLAGLSRYREKTF